MGIKEGNEKIRTILGETDERLDTVVELLKELIVVTRGGFNDIGKKLEDLELITKNGFDKMDKISR